VASRQTVFQSVIHAPNSASITWIIRETDACRLTRREPLPYITLSRRRVTYAAASSPHHPTAPFARMPYHILFVDDEAGLQLTVGDRLRREGYVVESAFDGDEAFEKASQSPYDLILLDVMLPRRDGFTVCADLRGAGVATPILMLTALAHVEDTVKGLKNGADDYVTKPFVMQELLARVEAVLRRTHRSIPSKRIHVLGDVRVDFEAREVTKGGMAVSLSGREFDLLQYLLEHAGRTVPRDELLHELWPGREGRFSRTIDMHVASPRRKLEPDSRQPGLFVTVPKVGYKCRL
jgi:two-component system, OmpR family, alkaline phosphatase synthesis response regulator PhoP